LGISKERASRNSPSDEQLLKGMLDGSAEAFTTLYRRRQASIYRFALQMSGSNSIAEEVTQEVFVLLMNQGDRYEPKRGPLLSYLFGIARNFVLRTLEKDRWQIPLEDEATQAGGPVLDALIVSSNPLGDLTRNERIESVRLAVLGLPSHYREVVVLCDFHELSYVDAAAALGIAVGTVRSRLHRAHRLLLEKLKAVGFTDSGLPRTQSARCCV
jgi:RNA polymerase sigma-70 factor (ECF subfamily)